MPKVKLSGKDTPTTAHIKTLKESNTILFYPEWQTNEFKQKLSRMMSEYQGIVDQAIARERELCDSYQVFYHGQRLGFRVLQDVLKEIYSFINIQHPLKDFEFLRTWYQAEKLPEVNEFIDREESELIEQQKFVGKKPTPAEIAWHDHLPHLTKNMLCVNLALFGNFTNEWESSFWYFVNNHNIAAIELEDMLKGIFAHFGFNKLYIRQILKLQELIQTREGNLVQIFIPKDKVDNYVYLSQPFGTPFRKSIHTHAYDPKRMRHTKISPILKKYCKEAGSIEEFDELQARVLLSQDCMLDPNSGVKIFKYTTASDSAVQEYQKQLNQILTNMFKEWVASGAFKQCNNTSVARLLRYKDQQ